MAKQKLTKKLQLQDLILKGKKVLVRVDFNVPLNKDGTISDDTRIREALPTIQYILNQGGSVILISHLGRPKSKRDVHYSLGICAKRLSQLIAAPVFFATDCLGKETKKAVQDLKGGQVILLENLRFYPAEENPSLDPNFAKHLASLGDCYVGDAFGTAHRAHTSTTSIPQLLPGKAALGLLMQKEIACLEPLFKQPQHPFFAVVGGAKISTKLGILNALLPKVEALFIGGGMAFTFFKAQGLEIGDSIYDETCLQQAQVFLQTATLSKTKVYFPIDLVIADAFRNDATYKIIDMKEGIPKGWQGVDIGPKTIELWTKTFQEAATLFWNGPFGVFEFPHFARGTQEMAKAIASLKALTVVGGGDSVAAINALGLGGKFSHVSTGGGAALEYLEFGHLPGIDFLSDKKEETKL